MRALTVAVRMYGADVELCFGVVLLGGVFQHSHRLSEFPHVGASDFASPGSLASCPVAMVER